MIVITLSFYKISLINVTFVLCHEKKYLVNKSENLFRQNGVLGENLPEICVVGAQTRCLLKNKFSPVTIRVDGDGLFGTVKIIDTTVTDRHAFS